MTRPGATALDLALTRGQPALDDMAQLHEAAGAATAQATHCATTLAATQDRLAWAARLTPPEQSSLQEAFRRATRGQIRSLRRKIRWLRIRRIWRAVQYWLATLLLLGAVAYGLLWVARNRELLFPPPVASEPASTPGSGTARPAAPTAQPPAGAAP